MCDNLEASPSKCSVPDDGSLEFVLGRPSSHRLERRRPEERYAVEQAINLTPLLVLLLLANELYQPFAMAAQPYQVVLEAIEVLGGDAAFDSGTMCTIQPACSCCRPCTASSAGLAPRVRRLLSTHI